MKTYVAITARRIFPATDARALKSKFNSIEVNGSENYPHGFREAMDDLGANNRNGTTNTVI